MSVVREEDGGMKPRIYIQVSPGRDFAGRSYNLWKGENPYAPDKPINLGAVYLFSLEETVRNYLKKLEGWKRRMERRARRAKACPS